MRGLLEAAHKSENPLEMLQGLLVEHPTKEMVELLVPRNLDLSKAEDCDLMVDIKAHWEQINDECSTIGWRSKFLYFATSMCHVFGKGDFFPDWNVHVITYLAPNKPMPYIWLNINSLGNVSIIQKFLIDVGGTIGVTVHCISPVNQLKSVAHQLNLGGNDDVRLPKEETLQISLRLDLLDTECPYLIARLTRPHPSLDCFIMLTFNGQFSGIYHKTKHPLIVNTIANPANKS